jgi:membrane protein DedA with SNARE-associated domain
LSLFGDLEPFIRRYGYAAVSAGLLLEQFGLPLPGETLLIGGAVLAARGELDIGVLLPLAWAAATIGNTIGFAIGRYGGHRVVVRHGGRVGITSARLGRVEAFFDRYGAAVLIGARFVVVARQLSGIAAGTLEMGWGRFALFNALGAALWVGWWGVLSYWLGRRAFDFVSDLNGAEFTLLALVGALAIAIAARLWWRRRG